MIELHYWPTPNGWKISIALEELELPYETRFVNIGRGEQFADEFLRISPNNRIPAIVDRDAEGGPLSIFESGAILTYLAEKTGRLMPTDAWSLRGASVVVLASGRPRPDDRAVQPLPQRCADAQRLRSRALDG